MQACFFKTLNVFVFSPVNPAIQSQGLRFVRRAGPWIVARVQEFALDEMLGFEFEIPIWSSCACHPPSTFAPNIKPWTWAIQPKHSTHPPPKDCRWCPPSHSRTKPSAILDQTFGLNIGFGVQIIPPSNSEGWMFGNSSGSNPGHATGPRRLNVMRIECVQTVQTSTSNPKTYRVN